MGKSSRKTLIASSAAYILGLQPNIEIKGSPQQMQVYKETLEASKNLYEMLQEGSDIQVENSLFEKKSIAEKFYNVFGWKWPL